MWAEQSVIETKSKLKAFAENWCLGTLEMSSLTLQNCYLVCECYNFLLLYVFLKYILERDDWTI